MASITRNRGQQAADGRIIGNDLTSADQLYIAEKI